jgi:large subunit ribosomal protein L22
MATAKVQPVAASKAQLRYVRVQPRKARAVANLIRGKNVNEATAILKQIAKKGAGHISDAIKSAMANAGQSGKVDVDNLFIQTITIDGGPVMKRYTARAQGRGDQVAKKTSHITVVLSEK